ncbi:MAG: glycoside hydrolase family 43 protein [Candidatus Ornithomonoglobus sp.]
MLYNEKNNNFVMWLHLDDSRYMFAGVGIAVSERPEGPFRLIAAKQPNRQDSRDMTLFKDEDGAAYLIHSKDWNKTLNIARLNEDYTDTDGMYVSVMQDQEREAPALCRHDGMYYMITSGCTGWSPNAALFARCPHIMGKWKLIDNPCEGENYRRTFEGQSAYIFEAEGRHYLMLDHWHRFDLKTSGYSILPIEFDDDDNMTVKWTEEWNGIIKKETE